jgi:hypothetical protein
MNWQYLNEVSKTGNIYMYTHNIEAVRKTIFAVEKQ